MTSTPVLRAVVPTVADKDVPTGTSSTLGTPRTSHTIDTRTLALSLADTIATTTS